jgi:Zn-dependent protease with chaperone function
MKRTFIYLLVLTFCWSSLVGTAFAAQEIAKAGLSQTNAGVGLAEGDPATTIGAALGVLLSVLSVIFLIICVYAGVTWLTAGGETDQIKKARSMLIQGALGLAVTLAAYAFTKFVVERIGGAIVGS